jgi:hypothetical protein
MLALYCCWLYRRCVTCDQSALRRMISECGAGKVSRVGTFRRVWGLSKVGSRALRLAVEMVFFAFLFTASWL